MIQLSAVVVFIIAVFVLCRWAGCKIWHALVCALAGFFIATSPLAPMVRRLIDDLLFLAT